jgi:hypothetical protein
MVISGVVKKDAVSFQTVSLNGRGLAKKRSDRLRARLKVSVDNVSDYGMRGAERWIGRMHTSG